jgi:hypothetical protein
MRSSPGLTAIAVLSLLGAGYTAPAAAQDHAYADSFGNLVIESAAGYKRIIVGEGHMARKLAGYRTADGPKVVRLGQPLNGERWADCYRPPVFVRGRAYMYGLADGQMPELNPCR